MGSGAALREDAMAAAALLAVDPHGLKGVRLRARAGPVRDEWLAALAELMPERPWRRMAAGVPDARLAGGLDLAATLAAGRPVAEPGVLAMSDGGVLVAAMAERLSPAAAALLGAALDEGILRVEREGFSQRLPARFLLAALDEGADEDETLPAALADRLGFQLDLDALSHRDMPFMPADPDAVAAARALLPTVALSPEALQALCSLLLAAGEASLRKPVFAARAARAAAAWRGVPQVEAADCALALRLVLGLAGATAAEEPPPARQPDPPPPPEPGSEADGDAERHEGEAADIVLQAVAALLPPALLDGTLRETRSRQASNAGRSGAPRAGGRRGRQVGTAERPPFPGARLDVLATLRAAAPWQRLRGRGMEGEGAPLAIRKADFRYPRLKARAGTTAICVLDASGSAAAERLAEAKGAVELLLGHAYVRRDQVALVAFRGTTAETLLEPTRALARAKRGITALPGGGGTPLAAGIAQAMRLTLAARAKGGTTVTVFLTDGRGNVALDGSTAKAQVEADVAAAAKQFRAQNLPAVVIDTAQRPRGQAAALAEKLGGRYLALPRAGAENLAAAISASMGAGLGGHDALPPA